MKNTSFMKRTLPKNIGWILAVLGFIGFFASAALAIEKVQLLENPGYVPSCDISPLLSCGSVMRTAQAEVFGFPNPFIGVAGFAVVATVGLAVLAGGVLRRWFWLGLQSGTAFGIIFVTWLQYQSIYSIGALCPYCMVVWAVTIPLFLYTLLYNLRENHIRASGAGAALSRWLQSNHGNVLAVWYAAIILAILTHFWYYWETLL